MDLKLNLASNVGIQEKYLRSQLTFHEPLSAIDICRFIFYKNVKKLEYHEPLQNEDGLKQLIEKLNKPENKDQKNLMVQIQGSDKWILISKKEGGVFSYEKINEDKSYKILYEHCPNDSRPQLEENPQEIRKFIYKTQLENFAVASDQKNILTSQVKSRLGDNGKIVSGRLQAIEQNFSLLRKNEQQVGINDYIVKEANSYSPVKDKCIGIYERGISSVDFQWYFQKVYDKSKGISSLDEFKVTVWDDSVLVGLLAYSEAGEPFPFKKLTLNLKLLDKLNFNEEIKKSFLANLKAFLLKYHANNLVLVIQDQDQRLTEEDVKNLKQFIIDKKIAVDIDFIPPRGSDTDQRKEIQEICSENIRNRNILELKNKLAKKEQEATKIAKIEKQQPEDLADNKQNKPKRVLRSLSAQVQNEQDNAEGKEQQKQVAVNHDHDTGDAPKKDISYYCLTTFETAYAKGKLGNEIDKVMPYPLMKKELEFNKKFLVGDLVAAQDALSTREADGDFSKQNDQYVSAYTSNYAADLWCRWFGNHCTGNHTQFNMTGISPAACEELLKYNNKFKYGLDLNNLPAGFVLEQGHDGYWRLDFSPELKILTKDPLKEQTTELPDKKPLTNAQVRKIFEKKPFSDSPIKDYWQKLYGSNYDRDALDVFKKFLPDLLLLNSEDVSNLLNISFKNNIFNKEIFKVLFENRAEWQKILSASIESVDQGIIETKLKSIVGSDQNDLDVIKNFLKNHKEITPDIDQHLISALIDIDYPDTDKDSRGRNKNKIKKLLKKKCGVNQLLQLYIEYGESGLDALRQVIDTDEKLFTQLNMPVQSYSLLINDNSRLALQIIKSFTNDERVWWDELLKQHCAAQNDSSVNLIDLVRAFEKFKEKLYHLADDQGKAIDFFPPACSIFGANSMPVTLSRILNILESVRPCDRAAQWKECTDLDWSSTGVIKANAMLLQMHNVYNISGREFAFFTKEMELTRGRLDLYIMTENTSEKKIIELLTETLYAEYVVVNNMMYTMENKILKSFKLNDWFKNIIKNPKAGNAPIRLTDAQKKEITSKTGHVPSEIHSRNHGDAYYPSEDFFCKMAFNYDQDNCVPLGFCREVCNEIESQIPGVDENSIKLKKQLYDLFYSLSQRGSVDKDWGTLEDFKAIMMRMQGGSENFRQALCKLSKEEFFSLPDLKRILNKLKDDNIIAIGGCALRAASLKDYSDDELEQSGFCANFCNILYDDLCSAYCNHGSYMELLSVIGIFNLTVAKEVEELRKYFEIKENDYGSSNCSVALRLLYNAKYKINKENKLTSKDLREILEAVKGLQPSQEALEQKKENGNAPYEDLEFQIVTILENFVLEDGKKLANFFVKAIGEKDPSLAGCAKNGGLAPKTINLLKEKFTPSQAILIGTVFLEESKGKGTNYSYSFDDLIESLNKICKRMSVVQQDDFIKLITSSELVGLYRDDINKVAINKKDNSLQILFDQIAQDKTGVQINQFINFLTEVKKNTAKIDLDKASNLAEKGAIYLNIKAEQSRIPGFSSTDLDPRIIATILKTPISHCVKQIPVQEGAYNGWRQDRLDSNYKLKLKELVTKQTKQNGLQDEINFEYVSEATKGNPELKKQFLKLYDGYLQQFSDQDGDIVEYMTKFIKTICYSVLKQDKGISLSLLLLFSQNSNPTPKDLFEFAIFLSNSNLDLDRQILMFKIVAMLLNDSNEYKIDDIKKLIQIDLSGLQYIYASAPFPSAAKVLEWKSNTNKSLQEQYDEYEKNPYPRDEIDKVGGNGFKQDIAEKQITEIKFFSKKPQSLVELEKFANYVKNQQIVSTKKLVEDFQKFKNQQPINYEELVAIAAELLYRSKGMEINTTQYLAIITLLKVGAHATSQIATGEGKSRIVAIANVCQCILGKTVDYVTSDSELLVRDYSNFKAYYDIAGVKTSLIFADSSPQSYAIGGINLSDVSNLSLFRNKAISDGEENLVIDPDPKKRALTADEADKLFYDSANIRYNYSAGSDGQLCDIKWVYALLVKYFMKNKDAGELFLSDSERSYEKFLQFASDEENCSKSNYEQLVTFSNSQIDQWQESALIACGLKCDHEFLIKPNQIITDDNGNSIISSEAKVLTENQVAVNSTYSLGVHQCLHARLNILREIVLTKGEGYGEIDENLKKSLEHCGSNFYIKDEKQVVYSSSSKSFLDDYSQGELKAVTGTAGTEIEKQEAALLYKGPENQYMHFIDMPRSKILQRTKNPTVLGDNFEVQLNEVLEQIKKSQQNNQPMLIVTRNEEESKRLYAAILQKIGAGKIQLVSAENFESASIKTAAEPGQITISTNMIGRGTDILLDKVAKENGLKVVVTYLPEERDLEQIIGRCARMGDKGEYQLILDKSKLPLDFQKIKPEDIDAKIQLMQVEMSRGKQYQRFVNNTFYDFIGNLHSKFFRGQYQKLSPDSRSKLLLEWTVFLSNCDNIWNRYVPNIDITKSQDFTANELDKCKKEIEKSWETLISSMKKIISNSNEEYKIYEQEFTDNFPNLALNNTIKQLLNKEKEAEEAIKKLINTYEWLQNKSQKAPSLLVLYFVKSLNTQIKCLEEIDLEGMNIYPLLFEKNKNISGVLRGAETKKTHDELVKKLENKGYIGIRATLAKAYCVFAVLFTSGKFLKQLNAKNLKEAFKKIDEASVPRVNYSAILQK